ncbi:MAG: T9SS type A sorting domain-containing protein [Flavobacteriales bacterium]|nr:T9SS type A sorting domain-containing protein [Flavobacteriales bacterium]
MITAISSSSDGHLESNMGDLDAWVFKVDLNGEVIWSSSYGGSNTDQAESLILMQDQSIAVVGFSNSIDGDIQNNIGSRDATITLFSAEGQFLSHLNVGTTSNDYFYSITLDQEGDLVCLGNTEASADFGGLGGSDYYVVSIDEELIVNWEQTFGGSLADGGEDVIPDENGLIVIGEHFESDGDILENAGLKDVSILRLGEVLMIEGCTDPLACNYHPEATVDDGTCEYIEVVDIQGELMSTLATNEEYTYPGDIQNNFTWDVVGAEILSGQGSNSINVNWNSIGIGSVCVTESSSEDCIGEQVCIDVDVMPTWIPTLNHPLFKLIPNPSDGLIQVQVTSQEIGSRCIIHNSRGQLIQDIRMDAETNSIDLRGFPAGLYVVTLRNNLHNHTKRLLLK